MLVETKIALNYILSFLYDKLPRRRVNLFGEELEKYLRLKLSLNWNLNENNRIELDSTKVIVNKKNSLTIQKMDYIDPCLIAAAKDSAMDLQEILQYLPNSLKLYINPGLVAFTNSFDISADLSKNSTTTTTSPTIEDEALIDSTDLIILYNKQQQQLSNILFNDSNELTSNKGSNINNNNLQQQLSLSLSPNQNNNNILQAATSPSSSTSSSSSSLSSNNLTINGNSNNLLFKKPFQTNSNKPFLNLNLPHHQMNSSSASSPLITSPSNDLILNKSSKLTQSPFVNLNTVDLWLSSSSSPSSATTSNNTLSYSTSSSSSSSSSSASSTSSFNSHDFSSVQDLNTNTNNNTNKASNNKATLPQTNTQTTASLFTTASFAQTKFGSTKSKNYVKPKQNKMLPNEFSAYIKQKSQLVGSSTNNVGINPNQNHHNQQLNLGLDNFNNNFNYLLMNQQQLNHQDPNDLAGLVNNHFSPSSSLSNTLINDSYSFDRFQQELQSLNSNQALLNNILPVMNNNSNSFYHNLNNILVTNNNNNILNHEQSELTFNLLKDIIDDNTGFDDLSLNSNVNDHVVNNNGTGTTANNPSNLVNSNNLTDKFDHLSLLN